MPAIAIPSTQTSNARPTPACLTHVKPTPAAIGSNDSGRIRGVAASTAVGSRTADGARIPRGHDPRR